MIQGHEQTSRCAEEYYYRIEDKLVSAGTDEFDNFFRPPRVTVILYKFKVLKHTNKGVWLDNYGIRRFMLYNTRKKFACQTIKEAQISFEARKRRQIKILRQQLSQVEQAITLSQFDYLKL